MSQVYFNNHQNETVVFDLFYRRNPEDGGFAIFAGLEQIVEYVQDLRFSQGDIEYLKSTGCFTEPFLEYLKTVRFTGDLWSIREGTPIFPYEPLIRVKAPLIEAQLLETAMLSIVNHQTLIATKARRIVQAAENKTVMEFGARRAHNFDSALYGARAAYIAGVNGTATTLAGKEFGIPALGTMAHSFVQSFPSEYEAFLAYAKAYPNACTLLVDTYNVLKSGVPNAIKVAKEYLEPNGYRLRGIRIDSGDMAYLSKKARKMLDAAGMEDTSIVVSNSLDERLIESLLDRQGAKIDSFGVGENLVVSKNSPVFGGVYKLAAIEKDGEMVPKIKLSENVEKITNPGYKDLYRIYSKEDGKAQADVMSIHGEQLDAQNDLKIFHPMNKWKNKVFEADTYEIEELLIPIFINGKLVYKLPSLEQIRAYCARSLETLWDEIKRFTNPQEYYVDLTENLIDLKLDMINNFR